MLDEAERQTELVTIHAADGLEVLEAELSLQEVILKDLSESQRKPETRSCTSSGK